MYLVIVHSSLNFNKAQINRVVFFNYDMNKAKSQKCAVTKRQSAKKEVMLLQVENT